MNRRKINGTPLNRDLPLLNGGQKSDTHLALELVRHRVIGKTYEKWKAIIAETGSSDTMFLVGLRKLHGIAINPIKDGEAMLFVVQDTQQMRALEESGCKNPTLLQILLTTRVISLTEKDATDRWTKIMQQENAE